MKKIELKDTSFEKKKKNDSIPIPLNFGHVNYGHTSRVLLLFQFSIIKLGEIRVKLKAEKVKEKIHQKLQNKANKLKSKKYDTTVKMGVDAEKYIYILNFHLFFILSFNVFFFMLIRI